MRMPEHISPTSFFLWKQDKDEYYKRYLSERRFVREPQTLPMAIGSAFDCMIKNYLIEKLKLRNPDYVHRSLDINEQVEEQNREKAIVEGQKVLDFYVASGALADLLMEIGSGARFEFKITGHITHTVKSLPSDYLLSTYSPFKSSYDPSFNVTLNGRPDAFYLTGKGMPVVNDWKVNGWAANRLTSPKAGYIDLFPERKIHKDAMRCTDFGLNYNLNGSTDYEWNVQLGIYGWLLGCPVGQPIIGGIDQIVGPSDRPRVAKFRFLIGKDFQEKLYLELAEMWVIIKSGWIFRDLAEKESVSRCEALEAQVLSEQTPLDVNNIDSLFR